MPCLTLKACLTASSMLKSIKNVYSTADLDWFWGKASQKFLNIDWDTQTIGKQFLKICNLHCWVQTCQRGLAVGTSASEIHTRACWGATAKALLQKAYKCEMNMCYNQEMHCWTHLAQTFEKAVQACLTKFAIAVKKSRLNFGQRSHQKMFLT